MTERPDAALLVHYDQCLSEHGDTARGADWPNEHERRTRFDVMLDVIPDWRTRPLVLCDLGCGTGELLAHLRRRGLGDIRYIGVDRSERAIELARRKFPDAEFVVMDVNAPDAPLERLACDYLVANGLFTVKATLDFEQMWQFMASTVRAIWPHVRGGIAFNVMSTAVDWQRDDLFHVPADALLALLHHLAGRSVRLRADYGIYEYTVYAYRAPRVDRQPAVEAEAAAPAGHVSVPVMRPRLPHAAHLLPYLKRIDDSRIYSNFGPLATELEQRLAALMQLPAGGVASAGSGLAALVGAILGGPGRATPARPYAVVPAYTFVATAVAVEQCGYLPRLVDVDAEDWLLSPDTVLADPRLDEIGLVVPVAALGRPVEQAAWQAFTARTGIPVVIDGAAAFEALIDAPSRYLGPVPVALSFHATKSFGTGEGGAVVSTDVEFVARGARALNFGFHGARDSRSASTNGKMSEYHAAVGLAELDGWDDKRRAMRSVAARYRDAFAAAGIGAGLHVSPQVGSSYVLYLAPDAESAERVCAALAAAGLDFRRWYGMGLHRQTYFSQLAHGPLPGTEDLAFRLLGLPVAPDLEDDVITRVAHAVAAALRPAT